MPVIKALGFFGDVVLVPKPNIGLDLLRANLLVGNYDAMNIGLYIPTPTGVHAT